ncbi:flavodoxin domain-containing protein [Ornithinimicrobium tianjinense]|uniref:flavodoxin domain-containing protein n=1 Tax=Ornithinimicrobium tianjinense TaxID=1195761 RepID=UPI0031E8353E
MRQHATTALVVYESAWGNTRTVAEAVADGLREHVDTEVVDIGSAPPLEDVRADLLVVGAPTHAFGLSRPATRADAHSKGGADVSSGVREWLDAAGHCERPVATFDTHIRHPNLPGTASKVAARRLRRLGCDLVAEPEVFWVATTEGPLLDGEVERAHAWGAALATRL